MNANITGENDERVGLYVTDNNDVEHWIEMEFDGEIKYHEQDGYPDDPDDRTGDGNEHVNQARRYAKYYVYQERGYDTLPWDLDYERFQTVQGTLEELSTGDIEEYFGDL